MDVNRKLEMMQECCKEFWGKKANLMEESRSFFVKHGSAFVDSPATPVSGEMNLEMHGLYLQYLKVFEASIEDYIDEKGIAPEEFAAAVSYVSHSVEVFYLEFFVKPPPLVSSLHDPTGPRCKREGQEDEIIRKVHLRMYRV
jgi:hypothetical protein